MVHFGSIFLIERQVWLRMIASEQLWTGHVAMVHHGSASLRTLEISATVSSLPPSATPAVGYHRLPLAVQISPSELPASLTCWWFAYGFAISRWVTVLWHCDAQYGVMFYHVLLYWKVWSCKAINPVEFSCCVFTVGHNSEMRLVWHLYASKMILSHILFAHVGESVLFHPTVYTIDHW